MDRGNVPLIGIPNATTRCYGLLPRRVDSDPESMHINYTITVALSATIAA